MANAYEEQKFLRLLSNRYPTVNSAAAEIINLSSMLNLPKGTEHFISDIHGEFTSFQHVLKNGSGSIARKIAEEFGNELTATEKRALATLVYYPEEKLELTESNIDYFDEWCKQNITRLIRVTARMASKYTRTKLRAATPSEFEYIIEELLAGREDVPDKDLYYSEITDAIIETGRAKAFITVVCRLIQHLAIDRLHVIGDIYDRGSGAVKVMDRLEKYHSVDVEWGNHDVVWMGAACGSAVCAANVVRVCVKYNNLSTLEDGYGINLVPLVKFALDVYGDDECRAFDCDGDNADRTSARVHKAITVIQMKLEGQLSLRRKEFNMEKRVFLDKIDYSKGVVTIGGRTYELTDKNFPTVDPENPYKLTEEEAEVMSMLTNAFAQSEKLRRHVDFLYSHGSMYRIYNGNLLYHGCIPMDKNGNFIKAEIGGVKVGGKALYDELEKQLRKARFSHSASEKAYALDVAWFVWSNERSPLFGKDKMATFERYFLSDKASRKEEKNAYYSLIDDEKTVKKIFDEFGINFESGHIINGHVPVKLKDGESPRHANGKVLIIDGGFSDAYRKVTGIAGYTLVSNSRGMKLVALEPFVSKEDAVKNEYDIKFSETLVNYEASRKRIADTDKGAEMKETISDLKKLMDAYKRGDIRERE